ncbi:MAG: serine/threonine protein kinase [Sporothrix thermara]
MTSMMQHSNTFPTSSSDVMSPAFTEDLTRFPSESLHSFSFAHQSGDLLHSHQNIFKRSLEFMKDRMGHAASTQAGLASAQARTTGDVETQNMLDLLASAELIGANNLPAGGDFGIPTGPLTGPPIMSGENVFEAGFIQRTTSPEPMGEGEDEGEGEGEGESSVAPSEADSPLLMARTPAIHPKHAFNLLNEERAAAPLSNKTTKDDCVPGPSDSAESSRTPTNESGTTQQTSPPLSRPASLLLRRTLTDLTPVTVQQRLLDTLATPYVAPPAAGTGGISPRSLSMSADAQSDTTTQPPLSATAQSFAPHIGMTASLGERPLAHPTRWVPAAQAIFTTQAKAPYTIIAANDLACLVFGVTKAEVRKMGILQVIQQERRAWLEKKLQSVEDEDDDTSETQSGGELHRSAPIDIAQPVPKPTVNTSSLLGARGGGITAKLLSKPNSRSQTPHSNNSSSQPQAPPKAARRAKTTHDSDPRSPRLSASGHHHNNNKSRGVLLCGDVVPIQKRNGATGSASLWVKEKRFGLIWVMEEIHEDVATVAVDEDGYVSSISGATGPIWGEEDMEPGMDISKLIPRIARQGIDGKTGAVDFNELTRRKFYTCRNCDRINIPATIEQIRGEPSLRVSSFPHIAGIIVVSTQTLAIKSSNSVFCGALFGYEKPNGLSINQLVPDFDKILQILVEVDNVHIIDGIVVPEHSFRRASAFLALRDGRPDAANALLRPDGLPGRHRDGSELKIDVQMRVVKSEKQSKIHEETVIEAIDEEESEASSSAITDSTSPTPSTSFPAPKSEMVYALWITYSRNLHAGTHNSMSAASPLLSGAATPMYQPSPGQTPVHSPFEVPPIPSDDQLDLRKEKTTVARSLTRQLKEAAQSTVSRLSTSLSRPSSTAPTPPPSATADAQLAPPSRILSPKTAAAATHISTPVVTVTTATSSVNTPDRSGLAKEDPLQPHTTSSPTPTAKQDATTNTTTTTTASEPTTSTVLAQKSDAAPATVSKVTAGAPHKKTIDDFVILEDMGQGAYGQVKLAKEKATGRRVVIKYVTKKRILVDTWTRDRRLGTVPLEIHVLDYLRRDGLRHPNIVEMEDFFEDDINYYIEMKPHGLPGMDLFDYIELRTNMDESECRNIFVQVAQAVHHLHTKALVVHRDIKDENIILDGEGNIKLIDFGSAAYIKSGPFDVFVGTIDYAAPEVLGGKPYKGKEQDVWALGILLYTIIYKENPFYSIDEIMDRDLRIPYVISEDSIDLIRKMLDRDVAQRWTIEQVLEHPWCQIQE